MSSILVVYADEASPTDGDLMTAPPTRAGITEAVMAADEGAVLAIGGDGFSAPTEWRAWVRELPRYRPGLGEALRRRLFDAGHPGAALVAAEGAVEEGRVILVAPDDAAVRDAALGVLAELSGASELSLPALPAAAKPVEEPPVEGVFDARVQAVEAVPSQPAPTPSPQAARQLRWRSTALELGIVVDPDRWGTLPDLLLSFAPVREVVSQAGERRVGTDAAGHQWLVCGYPDLHRPGAKVLAVRATEDDLGDDLLEVLALHRTTPTGTCSPQSNWTPATDRLPGPICVTRTGRAPSFGGTLFAVDGREVVLRRGDHVVSWDGRQERAMGTVGQALSTLVLRWSQR